jgi:ribose transport system ATP-binding protein
LRVTGFERSSAAARQEGSFVSDLVLRIEDVSKTYPGVRALDRFSLDCRAGEVHAVLGENGSGKTTLMKIASGTIVPDGGVVEIDGATLTSADPRLAHRLGLATVYQDDSLIRELSVAQNLFLAAPPNAVSFRNMIPWAQEQLKRFDVHTDPRATVGSLSPAQRQFIEIVKALLSDPKVLLLDEPTSTLDIDGVRKLAGLIRRLTANGAGIIYVSHRLPEILELAQRVTILRDGVHQGTFPVTAEVSEHDLVSLMVGRDIDSEYPARAATSSSRIVLSVRNLSGDHFSDVSFDARAGEIVGFAGAEGNGQREALRAIVGLEGAQGVIMRDGSPVDTSSPKAALANGLVYLSADRSGEAVFADLGVQKNMMLPRLRDFLRGGFLSGSEERTNAERMRTDFTIVTASLDKAISGLSGGNQQKTVLARSFRAGAKAVLIDEPTQGVDAGARFEIYKAIHENIRDDGVCIVNSSDAQELAGICDRVFVFSRGKIVRELRGEDVNEEQIVSSFLTVRDAQTTREQKDGVRASRAVSTLIRYFIQGAETWWMPLAFLATLTLLVFAYAASKSGVFLRPINLRHMLQSTAPAALVAMAQLNVLLVRGIDVSVGSLMSLTVVAASFLIASDTSLPMTVVGILGCLAIGVAVGTVNGFLVRYARVNSIITTIAMLSVLQGVALIGRPTPDGTINSDFTDFLKLRVGFMPVWALALVALAILGDMWLHRSRSGLEVKATGFREEAARRNGVAVDFVQIRAYVVASLMAAAAGLFLGAEVGVGHPTVGENFPLMSIAAAVLGGAALAGGRGSYVGALFGAFFFTLMINVISILGLSSAVGVIASGAMTLMAVFFYSGLAEVDRMLRKAFAPRRPLPGTAPAE